ncbi:hypothetical protein B2J73_20855 [Stutzerimonas stutzeri]|jgi:hypothetical protein|uniref:DUF4224 domain-containing protein n=1 Tax=Stutzerimonas stutzeri TaxID=316 RepID=UPI0009A2C9B0|nr:DUF4224 domain-containing protein [Stutzerimonas stutzeri]HBM64452.1 DUF4224 domain-containing protein [Pseudomonas sp.]MDH0060083.1 DUF4224 domain-containing protein [Stutzerimonas stutzeri]OPG81539.1 hypothetical protein B2J73_20855 [Stutzerimonas stutzeri]OSO75071.1 hypothetical protein B6N17_001390 [Stutzerimonas stutzeri]QXP24716.1 DUF4224 domain-containing protein [Stutzerimonas stutzeri]
MPTAKLNSPQSLQPGLVSFESLRALTGYERRSDIERSLQSQGIRFFYGRHGVWTTLTLINYAGGAGAGHSELYDAEIL